MINITDASQCCGCEACENACSHKAISMCEDEKGFLYPVVNEELCIDCGLCDKVCDFIKPLSGLETESQVYAVKNNNQEQLLRSASGGAFTAMAHWMIDKGGIVLGCSWGDNMMPYHRSINNMNSISCLQGSKYVQSRINDSYLKVRTYLNNGIYVLFSGTPCQCAGLRSFLRKPYDQLICVELICHGVPSAHFFRDYLDLLEKKLNGKIIDVKFRDKKKGWGALLNITYKNNRGKVKNYYLSVAESYYYFYYFCGNMYRPSCYFCKYASSSRNSDFTIGDYWGVKKTHPEINTDLGVSVMLANTLKGKSLVGELSDYMQIVPSTMEGAARENGQLVKATHHNTSFDFLWDIYCEKGASGLDVYYRNVYKRKIILGKIKRLTPLCIKNVIKSII